MNNLVKTIDDYTQKLANLSNEFTKISKANYKDKLLQKKFNYIQKSLNDTVDMIDSIAERLESGEFVDEGMTKLSYKEHIQKR